MRSSAHPTEVVIFGRTYQLRGERRPEELRRLARLVDGRMREIAPNPTQSDGSVYLTWQPKRTTWFVVCDSSCGGVQKVTVSS